MTPADQKALDGVADKLWALYQYLGDCPSDVLRALDVVFEAAEEIERISKRKERGG